MESTDSQDAWERDADFLDVRAGMSDMETVVYRFPNTERGKKRAEEYRDRYNADLRRAMGVSDADLEREDPDRSAYPEGGGWARDAELYREQAAYIMPERAIPVVGDDDPLPTDYPHDYR